MVGERFVLCTSEILEFAKKVTPLPPVRCWTCGADRASLLGRGPQVCTEPSPTLELPAPRTPLNTPEGRY